MGVRKLFTIRVRVLNLNDEEKIDLANILVSDVPAERLKWILRKTMGSRMRLNFDEMN